MREWVIGGWDEPDLVHTAAVVRSRGEGWQPYVPSLELVPCGAVLKPALFFRVGSHDYPTWAESVELRGLEWNWYQTKGEQPYVFVALSVRLEAPSGSVIGVDDGEVVLSTSEFMAAHGHRLTCKAVFDPADPAQCEAISVWASAPGPLLLFFVDKHLRSKSYVSYGVSGRSVATEKLAEAQEMLRGLAPPAGALAANAAAVAELTKTRRW